MHGYFHRNSLKYTHYKNVYTLQATWSRIDSLCVWPLNLHGFAAAPCARLSAPAPLRQCTETNIPGTKTTTTTPDTNGGRQQNQKLSMLFTLILCTCWNIEIGSGSDVCVYAAFIRSTHTHTHRIAIDHYIDFACNFVYCLLAHAPYARTQAGYRILPDLLNIQCPVFSPCAEPPFDVRWKMVRNRVWQTQEFYLQLPIAGGHLHFSLQIDAKCVCVCVLAGGMGGVPTRIRWRIESSAKVSIHHR